MGNGDMGGGRIVRKREVTYRLRHSRAVKLAMGERRRLNPDCQECGAPATTVHHRVPIKMDPTLAADLGNLVSLCESCHRRAHRTKPEQMLAHRVDWYRRIAEKWS